MTLLPSARESLMLPGPCFTPVLAPLCQNDLSHLVISFLTLFFHQMPSEGDLTSLLLKPGSLELWPLLFLLVPHPIHLSICLARLILFIHLLHSFHASDLPQATLSPLSHQPAARDLFLILVRIVSQVGRWGLSGSHHCPALLPDKQLLSRKCKSREGLSLFFFSLKPHIFLLPSLGQHRPFSLVYVLMVHQSWICAC